MSTPREEHQFIEINDFSGGIHSEFHGHPNNTASINAQGSLLGNGLAQADGTFGCHADKAGSLIPLPRAQPTGARDYIRPTAPIDPLRPFRYVLDAQVGNSLVDGSETEAAPFAERFRTPVHMMWATSIDTLTGARYVIHGREYRPWIAFPHADPQASDITIIDFLTGFVDGVSTEFTPLPIGSLTKARFYYGFTEAGLTEAAGDPADRPLWRYPVVVALAASPWIRWGAGNRFDSSLFTSTPGGDGLDDVSLVGSAVYPDAPGGGPQNFSPAIGANGEGTCIICMQLNDNADLDLPFSTQDQRWLFHYSEEDNAPQNDIIDDIAGGPLNPYMILSHQGRIIIPDRRRSAPAFTSIFDTAPDHGFIDDLLFFSDYNLPLQSPLESPPASIKGVTLATTFQFPIAAHKPYNTILAAEDIVAEFGTIGVITVDQLLLIKHYGGGALISGDMDNPTVTRFPYLESTGGLICKGANTPIGFVYGSNRGIFLWQGGDTSEHISPQLDGFFWDHTQGSTDEIYAGNRGRMVYWNRLVWVPNNYVYDIDKQSWWRVGVQNIGEAFGNAPSRFEYPGITIDPSISFNNITNADEISHIVGLDELDVRVAVGRIKGDDDIRAFASVWREGNDQRVWLFQLDDDDTLQLSTSTDGINSAVASSTIVGFTNPDTIYIFRATWRSSDGRVQFFRKSIGNSISGADLEAATKSNTGWEKLGADGTASTATLHTPQAHSLDIGQRSDVTPWHGDIYACHIATTIDDPAKIAFYPPDIPADPASLTFAGSGSVANIFDIKRDEAPLSQLQITFIDETTPNVNPAPYNCYDVDSQGVLHAFPYKHSVQLPSHATFPDNTADRNFLSIPDAANFSAPDELDIRFIIGESLLGSGSERTIASHWDETDDNRSWRISLTAADELIIRTSTDGINNDTATADNVFTDEADTVLIGRITWRASDGRVQFFKKAVGDYVNRMQFHDGWFQIGADETASTATLHDSDADLVLGHLGAGTTAPFEGDFYAFSLATTIGGTPVVQILPDDWPSDVLAASFICDTDQTVTVTRADTGAQLTLSFTDLGLTPPVFYTFEEGDLETSYSWISQPILESIDRVLSFQTVQVVATGNPDTSGQTVTVRLYGYDEKGNEKDSSVAAVLPLDQVDIIDEQPGGPQVLRGDFPAFNAQHVRVELLADDIDMIEAPKIHAVRLGYKERAHTPR